jgi:hypothetical protein
MAVRKLPLPPQWILALVVAAGFGVWWGVTSYGEHRARMAIELHTPFSRPALEMRFAKTIYYDPQSFVGRGRQAGYWEWSPTGLVLTEKGGKYFRDTGAEFATASPIGRRAVGNIHSVQTRPGAMEVKFRYTWTEVNEPAISLVGTKDAPRKDAEYEGVATLVEEGGVWKVQSLKTPDLDKPLAILLTQATGARR